MVRYAVLAAIVAELASVTIAASYAGWLWTLAVLALAGGLGMAVLAGRGVTTLGRASTAMQGGAAVAPIVVDGALVALAGLLLLIPGFVSDVVAVVLLVPPLRAVVRNRVVGWLKQRMVVVAPDGRARPDVIDTSGTEVGSPRASGAGSDPLELS